MDEKEYKELATLAKRSGLSIGEWVRRAIRAAVSEISASSPATKLKVIDQAMKHSFPSGDIEQILSEIEKGYLED